MVHTMKDQTSGSTQARRNHDQRFKDELIAQSLVPGASVSAIAMKGGINANLLFKWRREHLRAMAMAEAAPAAATLLPVCVIPDVDTMPTSQPSAPVGPAVTRGARSGVIEVGIAGALCGLRCAGVGAMLGAVLRALRQSA